MNENEIMRKESGNIGRSCKYETHVKPRLQEIESWIKEGLTDYCIADNLGIAVSTLYDYKANIVELSEVYTRARTKQVQKVVNATFQRAIGYDYEETTHEGDKLTKVVAKHVPGDVNAQRFYLTNRDPEHWQPENRIEQGNITINNFQLEDWQAKRQQILEEIQRLELQAAKELEPVEE